MLGDTIAAVGTAPGESGIGIVRLSGGLSVEILDKIFKSKKYKNTKAIPSRYMSYGHIVDEKGNTVDEVLAVIMKGPYSYTAEDVVEIHCHGGIVSIRRIMELVLKGGARIAEAGEFTKRAFLNGRIDLAQGEAVIDVITAKTEGGLNNALSQLEGSLSAVIKEIMEILITVISHIEASIDFPEHDIEELTLKRVKDRTIKAKERIESLLNTYNEGKIHREGLYTAIIGRPNAGKSSLLNILLKENRAIVTDIPGTTRDIIEEYLNLGGILIKLIDTAGLRYTEDVVEKIGVERTKDVILKADLIIFIMDISESLTKEDRDIMTFIANKKVIAVGNKIDLGVKADIEELGSVYGKGLVLTSIKEHKGIEDLETAIKDIVYGGNVKSKSTAFISNIRHKSLLDKALQSLDAALEAIDKGIVVDLVSLDIKDAWRFLGEITGDTIEEDIIDEIFSRFCIGK